MNCALRFTTILALLSTAISALPACKSEEQKAEEASWRLNTPLPHDPTEKFEIGPWWSDGQHLLNLNADRSYALYDHNNRHNRPMERGRWNQQGYAVLWLEPYTRREREPTRVSITKIDGRLALVLPKFKPMFALAAAPAVIEDTLMGEWQGPMGSLRLNADMTYTFTPPSAAPGGTRDGAGVILSHNGRWRLDKQQVTLTPTTPSVQPMTLKVRAAPPATTQPQGAATQPTASEPVLEGPGGDLVKVKAVRA